MRRTFKTSFMTLFLAYFLAFCVSPQGIWAKSQGRDVTAWVEAARSAGIPEADLNRVLALSVDQRLSAAEIEVLLKTLRMAWLDCMYLEPFLNKIEEGLRKRIPTQTIGLALSQKVDDYRFVRNVLQRISPESQKNSTSCREVSTIAESLSVGVSRQELERFIEQAPQSPVPMLAVAVENLALLRQIDFSEELANQILFTGLRLKQFTPSWRYLAKVIVAARNRGISDQDITQATITALYEELDLRELMARLAFTERDLRHGPSMRHPASKGP